MSEGTGSDFLDDVISFGGLGLFKLDEDGIGAGKIGEKLIEGTKEITGAAAAEDANALAKEQFEADKVRIDKERADATAQNERRQVSLSKGAARARGKVDNTATSQSSINNNTQTDFLGL